METQTDGLNRNDLVALIAGLDQAELSYEALTWVRKVSGPVYGVDSRDECSTFKSLCKTYKYGPRFALKTLRTNATKLEANDIKHLPLSRFVSEQLFEECRGRINFIVELCDELFRAVQPAQDYCNKQAAVYYLIVKGHALWDLASWVDHREYLTLKPAIIDVFKEGLQIAESLGEGLALAAMMVNSYTTFLQEECGEAKEAVRIARASFDKSIERIETLDETEYKDVTLQLSLQRDNITLWSSEMEEQDDAANGDKSAD